MLGEGREMRYFCCRHEHMWWVPLYHLGTVSKSSLAESVALGTLGSRLLCPWFICPGTIYSLPHSEPGQVPSSRQSLLHCDSDAYSSSSGLCWRCSWLLSVPEMAREHLSPSQLFTSSTFYGGQRQMLKFSPLLFQNRSLAEIDKSNTMFYIQATFPGLFWLHN